MKIVVVGTGLVGSRLLTLFRSQGHDAVEASPVTGVNPLTGAGLDAALVGASVVVDTSTSLSHHEAAVQEFLWRPTRNLLAAEAEAGVGHHVALSVVGAVRMTDSSDMRAKVTQERLVENGWLPYSIVRATHLFEHLDRFADDFTVDGVVRAPATLVQPMAAQDLAALLHDVALTAPYHGVVETGGPETFALDDLFRRTLAARGDPRDVVTDAQARWSGTRLRRRTLVPGLAADLGTTRLDEWLDVPLAEPAASPHSERHEVTA
jgi:uncharacterized protein YbjT (DUF2867 family)